MKKIVTLIPLFIGIALLAGIAVFANSNSSADGPYSPLPKNLEVMGAKNNPFLASDGVWLPKDKVDINSSITAPQINSPSVFVLDLTTGDVIYAKDVHARKPVASLAKIMTALVALERAEPSEKLLTSEKAVSVGEDMMGLTTSERLTLEELLYGLMLPSGNDAAETIAEGVGGTHEAFVEMMNDKTKQLGLRDTKFVNPSGLDGDGEHYSSAYDMAVIAKIVYEKYPLFRKIVGTYEYHLPYTPEHKELWLYNQTNLLTTYPGVIGIKPGFTPDAGLCLATIAENGGHQILAVILGSEDRRGEMRTILDYAFAVQGVSLPTH